MRFGMYFEIILNKRNGYFHVEILLIIVACICWGVQGTYSSSPEKFLKMWCSLVCFEVYFDEIVY